MKSVSLNTKYDHFIVVSFSLGNNHGELPNYLSLQYLMCLKYVICYVQSISYAWYGTRSLLLNPENRDVFQELTYKYQLVVILMNFITQCPLVKKSEYQMWLTLEHRCHAGEESRNSLLWFKSFFSSICKKLFFFISILPDINKTNIFPLCLVSVASGCLEV